MAAGRSRDRAEGWATASELADYAYCPRSWWYGAHADPTDRSTASDRSARAGARYHERSLSTERYDEDHGTLYLALLAVAAVLIAGSLVWLLGVA
jgi:CRISPR/Cas system-associated exonuclease Cas4 (RecB family)